MNRLAVVWAAVLGLGLAMAGQARAAGQWAKSHPRRHEVNKRERKQKRNTNKAVKEGKLSKGQGAKLNKEDRGIRQEERDMASQNGGHITKGEKRTLNKQENKVRRQKRRMERGDAAKDEKAENAGGTPAAGGNTPPPAGN